jgi:hypothetical protein
VQFNALAGFKRLGLPKKFAILYYGNPIALEMPKDKDNEIEIGKVMLTKIGEELAPICGSKPVDGFMDFVKERWKKYMPNEETEPQR